MREIKFRGRHLCGQWYYGNLIVREVDSPVPETNQAYRCVYIGDIEDGSEEEVEEDTIGQFTGLYDKNGVEIYEGDIVECVSWNEYFSKDAQPMELFRRKMYVDFRRGGFKMVEPMPEPMKDNEWDIIYNGDIVIIGNVFDNPDLIK